MQIFGCASLDNYPKRRKIIPPSPSWTKSQKLGKLRDENGLERHFFKTALDDIFPARRPSRDYIALFLLWSSQALKIGMGGGVGGKHHHNITTNDQTIANNRPT